MEFLCGRIRFGGVDSFRAMRLGCNVNWVGMKGGWDGLGSLEV